MSKEIDGAFTKMADGIADLALRVTVPKIIDDLLQEIPLMEELEEIGNADWQDGYKQALVDVAFSLTNRKEMLLKRLETVTGKKP